MTNAAARSRRPQLPARRLWGPGGRVAGGMGGEATVGGTDADDVALGGPVGLGNSVFCLPHQIVDASKVGDESLQFCEAGCDAAVEKCLPADVEFITAAPEAPLDDPATLVVPLAPAPPCDTEAWPADPRGADGLPLPPPGGDAVPPPLPLPAELTAVQRRDVIPPVLPRDEGKPCIVFDFDETLAQNRSGQMVKRPFVQQLLDAAAETCELVLWTASTEQCAGAAVDVLDPERRIFRHRVFRNDSWFSGVPYTKDLSLLKRDMGRTLIVENTPDSVQLNKEHALMVEDYVQYDPWDKTLKGVLFVIETLVQNPQATVPEVLKSVPLVNPMQMVKKASLEQDPGAPPPEVETFYYIHKIGCSQL